MGEYISSIDEETSPIVVELDDDVEMDDDDKKPNEINPIRSVGCIVGYFIVGLVIYLFFAWVF